MRMHRFKSALAALVVLGGAAVGSAVADEYVIDAAHSGVTFRISHLDLSWVHGRFDSFTGGFTLDSADPAKSAFKLNIKSESVDTNNATARQSPSQPGLLQCQAVPGDQLREHFGQAGRRGV